MKERPILFSGPMVRAILDGRKTQTRRVLKPQPFPVGGPFYRPSPMVAPREWHSVSKGGNIVNIQKLPYAEGTELWVREAFADTVGMGFDKRYHYAADVKPDSESDQIRKDYGVKWKPSIHMPRAASRITLRVTAVKVERLQDISDEDALAEGVAVAVNPIAGQDIDIDGNYWPGGPKRMYSDLWNSINGPGSWDRNDWVAAYSFERVLPK